MTVQRAAADGLAADDAQDDLDHVEAWNRRSGSSAWCQTPARYGFRHDVIVSRVEPDFSTISFLPAPSAASKNKPDRSGRR